MIEASRGNGVVNVRLFDGRELEVDFRRTSMRSDEVEVGFLTELLSRACWDNLILANLTVRTIPARTEGKPPVP
jgi:hypothetical protein